MGKEPLPIRVKCDVSKQGVEVGWNWFYGSIIETREVNVIYFINDSDRDLRIDLFFDNTGLQRFVHIPLTIKAHSKESWISFKYKYKDEEERSTWYFYSNEEMTLSHPEYRPKKIKLKFEKGKSFTF
jgi:hypothetical protein